MGATCYDGEFDDSDFYDVDFIYNETGYDPYMGCYYLEGTWEF